MEIGQYADATATSSSMYVASLMEIDGDLSVENSSLRDVTFELLAGGSNTCDQVVARVTGDLQLVDTEIADLTLTCEGGSHSAGVFQDPIGIHVQGDATLESVTVKDNTLTTWASYGKSTDLSGAVLEVEGTLTATDVEMTDNAVTSRLDCVYTNCYRWLQGGVVWAKGDATWTGGSLKQNTVELTGSLTQPAAFFDYSYSAPLYWTGAASNTLTLTGVDLGTDNNPDISGTVDYDGSGVSTVTCSPSGCN